MTQIVTRFFFVEMVYFADFGCILRPKRNEKKCESSLVLNFSLGV
jgi:hypothetical protein